MIRILIFLFFWGLGLITFSQKIIFSSAEIAWADSMMQQMTLREKIGQLFMLDIQPSYGSESRKAKILEAIQKYNLGGVILMKGDFDVAFSWVNEFQMASRIPMWIAIDGEWGINMRIQNTLKYPYQMTLGAIQNISLIRKLGEEIGKECKSIGVNVNFAPCVDVNVNPNNPVINFRSFGENKENVAQKGIALALGMQQMGVMTSFKHFPGHGDTDVDSHHDLPIINKPLDALQNVELYPFSKMIENNVWGAMVSHLSVPALDASGLPASFSYTISTSLLRDKMGFQGIIFSDALNMKGATKSFSPQESDLEAYKAGNDVLVFPADIEVAISKIEEYISSDEQKFEEFHTRLRRLMLYKAKVGLNISKITSYNPTYFSSSNSNPNYSFCQQLYDSAITYISEKKIPISNFINPNERQLLIKIGQDKDGIVDFGLKSLGTIAVYQLPANPTAEERMKTVELAQSYPNVLVLYKNMNQYSSKNFGFNYNEINFINEINSLPNVLNIVMGNPYSLKYFQRAKNILLAYEDNNFTNNSVLKALNGTLTPSGKIPVQVGKFRFDNKVNPEQEWAAVADVSKTFTNEIYNQASLTQVENLVDEMIREGVVPGCQIVALHKGKEIYNKAFGTTTYEQNAQPITPSHYYDLASLTKILSTTIAAMKLKDMGRMRVYAQMKDYVKLDSFSTMRDAFISQLLTHSAGFIPFIPFHTRFNSNNFYQYFSTVPEGRFSVKVAENLYVREDFKDSMWYEMSHSAIKNRGQYVYSDLSMYAMQKVVESITNQPLDAFVRNEFYKPLGVGLTYNPLSNGIPLSKIVPTENDQTFRKQLIHGYVHDQGASLYGGVAGHAGLFGTAADVAKVMQMLMNYGTLDSKKYLEEITVRQFTSQQNESSRRGLGFDKPEPNGLTSYLCSPNTFGHTGFTGTCAWADPDHELVFVFLSNRIHPDAENKKIISGKYRQKLQTYFYNYIGVK